MSSPISLLNPWRWGHSLRQILVSIAAEELLDALETLANDDWTEMEEIEAVCVCGGGGRYR